MSGAGKKNVFAWARNCVDALDNGVDSLEAQWVWLRTRCGAFAAAGTGAVTAEVIEELLDAADIKAWREKVMQAQGNIDNLRLLYKQLSERVGAIKTQADKERDALSGVFGAIGKRINDLEKEVKKDD